MSPLAEHLLRQADLLSRAGRAQRQVMMSQMAGDLDRVLPVLEELVDAQRALRALLLESGDPAADVAGMTRALTDSLHMLADLRRQKGERAAADAARAEVAALSEGLGARSRADALRAEAIAALVEGRHQEAFASMAAARDAARDDDGLARVDVALDLADLFQWLGDFPRARQALATAEDEAAGAAPRDMAAALRLRLLPAQLDYQHGLIHRQLGEFAEAETRLRRALPVYVGINAAAAAGVEYQLAAALVGQGRHAEALATIVRLEPAFDTVELLRARRAGLLRAKAQALTGLGRHGEALAACDEALVGLADRHDPDLAWRVHDERARALHALGRDADALAACREAIAVIGDLRTRPLGHRLDSTFLADKRPLFALAVRLALALGRAADAAEIIEHVKARGLALLLGAPATGAGPGGSTLAGEFDRLGARLDALEGEVYADAARYTAAWREERAAVLARRAEVLERLRVEDPRWRAASAPGEPDVRAVLPALAARDQAVISLFLTGEAIVAVLLAGGEVAIETVPFTSATRERLESFSANLQARRPAPEAFDLSAAFGLDAEELVPAVILDRALRAGTLVILPHQQFHLVPWAGLLFRGRRLFEHCPVGVLPNLTCVARLDADPAAAPRAALIGAPDYGAFPHLSDLPGARAELEGLEASYRGLGRLLAPARTGPAADLAGFDALSARPDADDAILHLAAHAGFEPGEPLRSGLMLADGRLDAALIVRRRLRYAEVVLSGCSTGMQALESGGVPLSGDDLLGLPGAFLEAGARAVLVSIPKAGDDAAHAFMTAWHRARCGGSGPLAATQAAFLGLRDDRRFASHEWLGFTLYGCR